MNNNYDALQFADHFLLAREVLRTTAVHTIDRHVHSTLYTYRTAAIKQLGLQ